MLLLKVVEIHALELCRENKHTYFINNEYMRKRKEYETLMYLFSGFYNYQHMTHLTFSTPLNPPLCWIIKKILDISIYLQTFQDATLRFNNSVLPFKKVRLACNSFKY